MNIQVPLHQCTLSSITALSQYRVTRVPGGSSLWDLSCLEKAQVTELLSPFHLLLSCSHIYSSGPATHRLGLVPLRVQPEFQHATGSISSLLLIMTFWCCCIAPCILFFLGFGTNSMKDVSAPAGTTQSLVLFVSIKCIGRFIKGCPNGCINLPVM